jgi:hypothetical protein
MNAAITASTPLSDKYGLVSIQISSALLAPYTSAALNARPVQRLAVRGCAVAAFPAAVHR